ncbi:MAG TPA: hypothetical protein VFV72_03765 [Candidatus Limnocylindrales bacterium]|nr:hypothetical protein [Candidatus Limnocylindrales bacterium]
MNAEFNWWLLIVGLVIGAALTWLVMAESARRDADVGDDERRSEAVWISSLLSSPDQPVEPRRVEEILRLHAEYLAAPPPDEPDEPGNLHDAAPIDAGEESEEPDEHEELESFEEREAERASAAPPAFEPGVMARPKAVGMARPRAADAGRAGAAAPQPDGGSGAPTAPREG